MRPATDIPGIGRISIVADAAGAIIGLMEPVQQEMDELPDDFVPMVETGIKPESSLN